MTTETTETTETTIAQKIAAEFDTDGQCWETGDGRYLIDVCQERGGEPTYRDGYGTDVYRYDFEDDSSIVCAGAGWDFGLPGGCYCWEGAQTGHSDDCELAE